MNWRNQTDRAYAAHLAQQHLLKAGKPRTLLERWRQWRARRKLTRYLAAGRAHRQWLKRNNVIPLGTPHHSAKRNGTQAVP